jgi:hypothetical protein
MYSVCLYCSHALGQNDVVEAFPVGRRLAFDAAKGRLWVVCPACQRWCLAPIEERWEALEACEKAFRTARIRASTDEIGLVRLREGLELVRIGSPVVPELATWRYGREFSTRRRKTIATTIGAAGLAALGGSAAYFSGLGSQVLSLFVIGVPAIHMTGLLGFAAYSAIDSARAIRLRHDGKELRVFRADLRDTNLVATDGETAWGLRLKHSYGRIVLTGDEAVRATSRLLARANGTGASGHLVRYSTDRLLQAPSLRHFVRETAAYSGSLTEDYAERKREFLRAFERNMITAGKFDESRNPGSLMLLAPPTRLALEMALHEESERIALSGELTALRTAWVEAEQIAGISDSLLVPAAVDAKLSALRESDGHHRNKLN